MIYSYTIEVQKEDIDINGHVSNTHYLQWYVNAATRHSEALGVGYTFTQSLGVTWVAKEHHIYYKLPAFLGETLSMQTWIESIKTSWAERKYRLMRGEELIGEASTIWVMVDSKKQKPCRIPKQIIGKYEAH